MRRYRATRSAPAVVWSAAVLVVLIVGASRIYLGAHWLTDVLAGYALGASWVAIVVAVLLITSSGTGRVRPVRERDQAPTPEHQNRLKPRSPAPRPARARYAATGPSQRHSSTQRAPSTGRANPLDQEDRAARRRRGGERRVSAAGAVEPAGGPGNQQGAGRPGDGYPRTDRDHPLRPAR